MVDYALLEMLEKSLDEILQNEDVNDANFVPFCTIAKSVLEVSEVKLQFIDDVNMHYVMRILPELKTLDEYHSVFLKRIRSGNTESMVEEMGKTRYGGSFVIELNLPLINRCRFNAKEISAILLNSVLYTFYSEKIFTLFTKSYYKPYLELPVSNKDVFEIIPAVNKLVRFPILEYFETPIYNTPGNPYKTEIDEVLFRSPYGNAFCEAMVKLTTRSSNFYIDMVFDEIIERGKNIAKWVFSNTEFLKFRKSKLRDYLTSMVSDTTSNLTRKVVNDVYFSFFSSDLDEMKNITEGAIANNRRLQKIKEVVAFDELNKREKRAVQEGLFNRYKKAGTFDMSKIDLIEVEIDRIESYDDKVFVINLIHEYLDVFYPVLSLSDDEIAKKVKKPRHAIEGIIKTLNGYLVRAKNAKVYERQYGVFVKYPKGYEG